jgi:L-asparaginase
MARPRLLLIATGGTIAGTAPSAARTQGYAAAALPVGALLDAVPAITDVAEVTAEQPYAIGSQHLGSGHWLRLAERIRAAAADPAIDGIVIAHGTDTLEETALWLDLACPRATPVVVTGAMRPASALSADGPMNLYAAVVVAADPASRGAGTVVALNDQVFGPDRAAKVHTSRVDAFAARDGAPLALVLDGRCCWRVPAAEAAARRPSLAARLAPLPATLPRVDLIAQQVDADPAMVDWLRSRGARGIVVAGTGHGSLSQPMQDALGLASAGGCLVVRASRLAGGPVLRGAGVDDDALGFVAAGFVSPHKARLVTSAALAAGLPRAELQAFFDAL